MPKIKELNAIVTQKVEIAPGLAIFRFVPDGWDLPEFVPGQFAVVGLPQSAPRCANADAEAKPAPEGSMIQRAYSIASSPLAKGHLDLYVILVPEGSLTPRLFQLQMGDRLWLSPKITGKFTIEEIPEDANLVLAGTGTGIAPYISMVRTYLSATMKRKVAIVHGCRHSWELGYGPELTALERISTEFAYIPTISRSHLEHAEWKGHTDYVQHVWQNGVLDKAWGFHPTPEDTQILMCGNPGMIEDMEAIIQSEGFKQHTVRSPGQYHVEKYW